MVIPDSDKKFHSLAKNTALYLDQVLNFLEQGPSEAHLFLISNDSMRELNQKSRNLDKVTNVISFESLPDFPHPETSVKFIGEIYLAPDYIKDNNEDLKFLALHGLLHLLGYDHKTESDAAKMSALESKIMESI